MKILYITQFFPPEPGAASVRAKENIDVWVRKGYKVTVLTGFPSYLSSSGTTKHQRGIFQKQIKEGITIIRLPTLFRTWNSIGLRFFNEFCFMIFCIIAGVLFARHDIVLATSPSFGTGLTGFVVSRLKRSLFVFDVRDLYPETANALGVITHPLLYRFLMGMAGFYYTKAHRIVVTSQGARDHVIRRFNIPGNKIVMLPNGANMEMFSRNGDGLVLRGKLKLMGKFVVVYTGLLGRAQGLETLLEAANILKEHISIAFLLVGDGVEKEQLLEINRRLGLESVIFIEAQPVEKVPGYIQAGDAGYVSKKNNPVNRLVLPVKMFEYMAGGKPVLLSVKGEAQEILVEARGGFYVKPEDPKALADTILKLYRDRALCKEMGENGRRYVGKHYSREVLAHRYGEVLEALCETGQ